MEKMLTDKEVLRLAGPNTGIITYPELANIDSIGELFMRFPKWILIYQMKEYGSGANATIEGHWTGFTKIGREIHFFDSYSGKYPMIDGVLEEIPKEYAEKSGQNHTYLSNLFRDSIYDIHYNEHQYQKYGKGINTCGRHVGLFLSSGMTTDQYYKYMSKLKKDTNEPSFDQLVVDITRPFL